jgi:hypothetical protein
MKNKLIVLLIATNIALLLSGLYLWKTNSSMDLEYYQDQRLLVNANFGYEVTDYHPTANPTVYCYHNLLFKTCFKKFELRCFGELGLT